MFREVLKEAVNKLCETSYAIGYVNCDTAYFDDDCFDFGDVCEKIPCLFFTYNKEKIHVYIRIPKVNNIKCRINHFLIDLIEFDFQTELNLFSLILKLN